MKLEMFLKNDEVHEELNIDELLDNFFSLCN